MEALGSALARQAITERRNIVCEASGSADAMVRELLMAMKATGYVTQLEFLTCDIEVAQIRNLTRGRDNISAYYAQDYHLRWLLDAAHESVSGDAA